MTITVIEAQAAKAELEQSIATLLMQFTESTNTRVVDLQIGGNCLYGCSPTYIVDVEVQL